MTLNNAVGTPAPNRATPPSNKRASRKTAGFISLGLIAAIALTLRLFGGDLVFAQDGGGTPEASPEASPAATPAPDAPRIELEFTELNDSGVTGTATLFEAGDRTILELALEDTGENHPAHIHEGNCEAIQAEAAYNLENVGEDGTSTSVVDASLTVLIAGDYVIDLHLAPDQLGTLIACADIEGTPEVPGQGGEGTETPGTAVPATETATTTGDATVPATEAPLPTEAPTAAPTTEPTVAPATEPIATLEPTAIPEDGTGGADGPTTTDGTGADTGKGMPVASVQTPAPVGGTTANGSDGTQGGNQAFSGKGTAINTTTALPASTGSGSSLVFPDSPLQASMWASGIFSMVLAASALMVRRGEVRKAHATAPGRWRRLGL